MIFFEYYKQNKLSMLDALWVYLNIFHSLWNIYVSESVVYKGLDDDKDEIFDLVKMKKTLVNSTISLYDESYIQVIRKTVLSRKVIAVKRQQSIEMQ